ncbi:hypothetical protein [Litorisediminicola beolgyonensis]|uniref:ABC transporter permease n=1 Tax=Litorisediminicola beolgyonensis TaxID=1173614 RepID=A0ABW3ZGG1_9RHOB
MQTITHGARGLQLIWRLNTDRLLFVGTLGAALMIGAALSSL